MSATWLGQDVMDHGLLRFGSNAQKLHVIDGYSLGATYATVVAASVGNVGVAGGDFSLSNVGNDRKVTVAAKTIASASGTSAGDLHIAVVDDSNTEVLAVWEETTDQIISSGNPIEVPQLSCSIIQPT